MYVKNFLRAFQLKETPVKISKDNPKRKDEALNSLVPEDGTKPYDMKKVIELVDTEKTVQVFLKSISYLLKHNHWFCQALTGWL
jgi:acetyl-CoA carboxylase carboxyltransferase component